MELLDENNSALNNRLLQMYKMQDRMQDKKRPAVPRRNDKSGEPIDILSSDEDGSAAPKLPKINDQITITPHIPTRKGNSTAVEDTPRQQQNQNSSKNVNQRSINLLHQRKSLRLVH